MICKPEFTFHGPISTCNRAHCPTVPLTSVILPAGGADDIFGRWQIQARAASQAHHCSEHGRGESGGVRKRSPNGISDSGTE